MLDVGAREVGEFRVERVLGRGGMGVVYLAVQQSLGRRVALKVIAPQFADDQGFQARFVREAQTAASLDHPHVIPVYAAGTLEGTLYLAMRYVEGVDLARLLQRQGRLEPQRAVGIVAQVADALDAAHAGGLLHRDIKPANVLIADPGGREHVYLSDFGIARHADAAPTSPGAVAGTLDYLAPELLEGAPPSVASDVYALGCVLHEALTGQVPFPAASPAAKVEARLRRPVPRVGDAVAELPAALDAVVCGALARDPAARPPSAGALARAAEHALAGRDPAPSTATEVDFPTAVGNLREARTHFVGRERELNELERLLDRPGPTTVVGPGGAGKTRLATEAGRRSRPRFSGGVWLVELASVTDPRDVPAALAAPFGVDARTDSTPPFVALARLLSARRTLLIVDNCEHVIDAVAAALDELLSLAPDQHVLATSREPLAIAGEQVWRIPPLELPDATDPGSAADTDAIRLFVDRARLVRPSFAPDREELQPIAEICRRLDGVPLAIELAAARVGVLPMAEIVARLDDRFALLAARGRSATGRHRTLRAAVDWSHDLLDDDERALFRRLAVFRGSFALHAAETVCGGDASGLVDRSLVDFTDAGRYRLLETIRLYAAARLDAAGESHDYRARHAAYYTELAEAERAGADRAVRRSLRALDAERDNLAAALEWTAGHDADRHVRLACALGKYWHNTSQKEALRWIDSALVLVTAPLQRARLLFVRSLLAGLGTRNEGEPEAREAYALFTEHGDDAAAAQTVNRLTWLMFSTGRQDEASRLAAEGLERALRSGDDVALGWSHNALGLVATDVEESARFARTAAAHHERAGADQHAAVVLSGASYFAIERGEYHVARSLLRDAAPLAERSGDTFAIAHVHGNRGLAELFLGRLDEAETSFRAQLAALQTAAPWLQDFMTQEALLGLAGVAGARGDHADAARLAGAATRSPLVGRSAGEEVVEQRVERTFLEPAREVLGDEAWERAFAGG